MSLNYLGSVFTATMLLFSIYSYKEPSALTEDRERFTSPRMCIFFFFFRGKLDCYSGALFLLLYGSCKVGEESGVLAQVNFHGGFSSMLLWQHLSSA